MNQPCVNIGMVGHVDHGKTTLVSALSGVWAATHSEEIKRGITIRLGYADITFRKCNKCSEPECYTIKDKCPICKSKTEIIRIVSFVDSPGHETLMATMLSGAAIMNGAILVIAANEKCPQPQTKEHLMAIDIIGIKNVVIVQNKIDLVSKKEILEHYKQIKEFIKGTVAENAPIIPISAQQNINIDILIQLLNEVIPTPDQIADGLSHMLIARSFDVNKPGTPIGKIKGGVLGGTITKGMIRVGDLLEIRPGRKIERENMIKWEPIITEVTQIITGKNKVKESSPGGLLAIGTKLDPAMTKSDKLVGQVVGQVGTLPPTRNDFTMEFKLLNRIVGVTSEDEIINIKTGEPLMLNIGTATTVGVVTSARSKTAKVNLKRPVCAEDGARVAISRQIGSRWRLIGVGEIK